MDAFSATRAFPSGGRSAPCAGGTVYLPPARGGQARFSTGSSRAGRPESTTGAPESARGHRAHQEPQHSPIDRRRLPRSEAAEQSNRGKRHLPCENTHSDGTAKPPKAWNRRSSKTRTYGSLQAADVRLEENLRSSAVDDAVDVVVVLCVPSCSSAVRRRRSGQCCGTGAAFTNMKATMEHLADNRQEAMVLYLPGRTE